MLPLLLIMLFAIIDFGWVLTQQLSVSAAAREGARYYAIHNARSGAKADGRESCRRPRQWHGDVQLPVDLQPDR